ncbi:unnamed protein product [Clonostachys rosea f. rosea IK726]|uniref:Uncharacterized protein n=1 Tax=Clonostachys rosea f. rosea IK726 TaxID=1349383 RepID=A0ACA9UH77_BIOOC|nr:unnamed protein product [Clonostachys rosea f. rosea IK726]
MYRKLLDRADRDIKRVGLKVAPESLSVHIVAVGVRTYTVHTQKRMGLVGLDFRALQTITSKLTLPAAVITHTLRCPHRPEPEDTGLTSPCIEAPESQD